MSKDVIAKPEEYFMLRNGTALKSLEEFRAALRRMDEITFRHHVGHGRNDFGNWILHVFGDRELSQRVFNSGTREGIISALDWRLGGNSSPKEKKSSKHSSNNDKINQILLKEKEIEKREQMIEQIEQRIESQLGEMNSKKRQVFFSKEFTQGLLIGILAAILIGLVYLKFWT